MQLGRKATIVGEPPQCRAGFRLVTVDGREEIRVRPRRSWRALPFHSAHQLFWTCGGLAALYRVAAHPDFWNLVIFCIAMLCCLQIIAALAWMAVGEEIIRLVPGRLEIGYRLLGVERMRSTPIEDVCYLATWDDNPTSYPAFPVGGRLIHGAIKFETPERTIFFAAALNEEEAQQVVDHLLRRWPPELRG